MKYQLHGVRLIEGPHEQDDYPGILQFLYWYCLNLPKLRTQSPSIPLVLLIIMESGWAPPPHHPPARLSYSHKERERERERERAHGTANIDIANRLNFESYRFYPKEEERPVYPCINQWQFQSTLTVVNIFFPSKKPRCKTTSHGTNVQ